MSGLRRIRHARLACESDGHAWRGRALLEDAMRTASLGDEGRLILVRRLALGRLAPGAGAQEWGRRCEEKFRALREVAVSAESAAAARAEAVFFRDAAALWVALAVRAARGVACGEWFWRAGARGWHPAMPRAETLRLCFARLAEIGGLLATVELGVAMARAGCVEVFLDALEPAEIARLLPPARVRGAVMAPTVGWRREIARAVRRWSPIDPRARWLAMVAVLATGAELRSDAAAAKADFVIGEISREFAAVADAPRGGAATNGIPKRERRGATNAGEGTASAGDEESTGASATRRAEEGTQGARENPADAPPPSLTTRDESAAPARAIAESKTGEARARLDSGSAADRVPTNFGGLFFLVPLFARLGAAEMPHGAAWLGLRLALDHIARDGDDALRGMLPEIAMEDVPCDFALRDWQPVCDPKASPEATRVLGVRQSSAALEQRTPADGVENPPRTPLESARGLAHSKNCRMPDDPLGRLNIYRWRKAVVTLDATGRLPLRGEISDGDAGELLPQWPAAIHPAAAALALGAHRLCRKLTRLGLRTLIQRPARIAITRTHVDVFLPLANVDTRIRRAALDSDPGWVPWLGRAVAFHYTLEA